MSNSNNFLQELAKSTTEDLYQLLGVEHNASPSAIHQGYRKASKKYHPDKNPDNEDAADRFIYLGWARDILIDEKLKGEYDRARTRRREKALQDELLNSRRREMKDDLETREREASDLKRKRAGHMDKEVERLAEDGKRRRKELQARRERERKEEAEVSFKDVKKSPEPQTPKPGESSELDRTVKVQFRREGETAAWDEDKISSMFAKYGKIDIVIMGKDKKIRPSGEKHRKTIAIVFITYTRLDHAHAAVLDGKSDYPRLESVFRVKDDPPTFEDVSKRLLEAAENQLSEHPHTGGKDKKSPPRCTSFREKDAPPAP
ncbi:hypothetical protein IG631_07253 [Alternaria alternata]|nr:hypothetical protein IG631_07253 [Alternaria alternata]